MPRGTYLHLESGREEEFQCAPGPAGWRYVAAGVDLAVDSRWRPARLQVTSGDWTLRGGAAGAELIWVRSSVDASAGTEHSAKAHGFLGESPAFLVAVARSLLLTPGGQADVPLVQISGSSLATRTILQRWALTGVETHETDMGPLPVESWTATDLETAESIEFHLAGDVVLAGPGLELTTLASPPNL